MPAASFLRRGRELRVREPARGELAAAIRHIEAAEHAEREHLFGGKVRFELRRKVATLGRAQHVAIAVLHAVVHYDRAGASGGGSPGRLGHMYIVSEEKILVFSVYLLDASPFSCYKSASILPVRKIGGGSMIFGWLLLGFFVLGWAFYMAAVILMEGSIFRGLREFVGERAVGNGAYAFFNEMLGCLMCTATEASLWTLGVASFILGWAYRIPDHAVSMAAGRSVVLPSVAEGILAFAAAFALSLAVAGEAWAINVVIEHRRKKFDRLRAESEEEMNRLLGIINKLEEGQLEEAEIDLS